MKQKMNKEEAIQKNEMSLKFLLRDLCQTAIALSNTKKGRPALRYRFREIEQVILMSFRLAQINNGQQASNQFIAVEKETK